MEQYYQLFFLLGLGLPLTWLVAKWLVRSDRTHNTLLRRKSFWKLIEIPWLALACAAIVISHQSNILRDLESESNIWQSFISATRYDLKESLEEYSAGIAAIKPSKFGLTGCKPTSDKVLNDILSTSALDITDPTHPIRDQCIWVAFLHRFAANMERDVPLIAIVGGNTNDFAEIAFLSPLSTPATAIKSVNKARALLTKSDINFQDDIVEACNLEPDINSPMMKSDVSRAEIDLVKRASENACAVIISIDAYASKRLRINEGQFIRIRDLYPWWSIVLAMALLFRIARTTAEYFLDKEKEDEEIERRKAQTTTATT